MYASPFSLFDALLEKIHRERDNALAGKPARIIAKVNSVNETGIIDALYEASQAGVKIDLIVRGICSLRPRRGRSLRKHTRTLDRRPFPRTLARLLLPQRRPGGVLLLERGLDGAQPLSPQRILLRDSPEGDARAEFAATSSCFSPTTARPGCSTARAATNASSRRRANREFRRRNPSSNSSRRRCRSGFSRDCFSRDRDRA